MALPGTLLTRTIWLFAVGSLALLLAACGGGGGNDDEPTARDPTATAVAAPTVDDTIRSATELGEAPVFYGTLDEFETLLVGEPYKLLFRITNGYEEETLRIVARRGTGGEVIEFEALRAEPVGEEERPGTFYPFNLELPQPGTWQVTVFAGADEVTFPVQAKQN